MSDTNTIVIAGRLTRAPEVRYLPSDKVVCSFSIASDDGWGERKSTVFVDVEAWGRTAECVGQYCDKGSQVLVSGSIKLDQWEDKDGNKRSKIKIRASKVQFIGGKSAGSETAKPCQEATTESASEPVDYTDSEPPF